VLSELGCSKCVTFISSKHPVLHNVSVGSSIHSMENMVYLMLNVPRFSVIRQKLIHIERNF